MPKLTHYLVPKKGGEDPLNLSLQGYDALAINLINVEGGTIYYRATSDFWADDVPPDEVSVRDYDCIEVNKWCKSQGDS